MQSPQHRANLLSPDVDRVGVAVVASESMLFAVADYARGVQPLTFEQAEARVAALIRSASGIEIAKDPATARAACAQDEGFPASGTNARPALPHALAGSRAESVACSVERKAGHGQLPPGGRGQLPAPRRRGLVHCLPCRRPAVLIERQCMSEEVNE